MAETRTVITANGTVLGAAELELVESVVVEERLGSPDRVSLRVLLTSDDRSAWTSPVDALVAPMKTFVVEIARDEPPYRVDARSVSASWEIVPDGVSTLTIEGMDRSVEMDREVVQKRWEAATDAEIARQIFQKYHLQPQVDTDTPTGPSSEVYSPQQSATDWQFLKSLADRNGFDVRVASDTGNSLGVFERVKLSDPQITLSLGYGSLGGTANASVQLLAGREVHVARTVPGTTDVDTASDPGTGNAMGARSLGGVTVVRTNTSGGLTVLDAQAGATAMAERSAFGASLSVQLATADMPLVRARRPVTVAGLGEALNGCWLVRSVRHTINQGGHTQALELIRNALGESATAGVSAAALGVAL